MVAFGPRRITRQATFAAQRVEVAAAAGQHLVHVGLVAGVEDDRVVRRLEHPVQRQSEFHHTEIGPQVATGGSNLVDQKLTDLPRQFSQLILRKLLQISGAADLFKH